MCNGGVGNYVFFRMTQLKENENCARRMLYQAQDDMREMLVSYPKFADPGVLHLVLDTLERAEKFA